jgi:hypothetical protein
MMTPRNGTVTVSDTTGGALTSPPIGGEGATAWHWGSLLQRGAGPSPVQLLDRLARLGCTRRGSPGIFGYSGG